MSSTNRINWLLEQVQLQVATPEELKELLDLIGNDASGEIRQQLNNWYAARLQYPDPESFKTPYWENALMEVLQQDEVRDHEGHLVPVSGKVFLLQKRWWAAAAIVLLLLSGTWLWFNNNSGETTANHLQNPAAKDLLPGKPGAILTLADGSKIVLDSLKNGLVADQQGTAVELKNGQLQYDAAKAAAVSYNTMSTPRGNQFGIQLPDGTKAWLNAASSITYPTSFKGSERKVSITGEVYFEVVHSGKPFKVTINDRTQVEVLGTHFNINAYSDEPMINTSLLEGAVRVTNGANRTVLQPGQQAQVNNQLATLRLVKDVDLEKVMAWKNGVFNFQDASLPEVMRQLERWYDIQVKYEGTIPDMTFKGKMDRGVPLSILLNFLSDMNIQSKLEGRTLTIKTNS